MKKHLTFERISAVSDGQFTDADRDHMTSCSQCTSVLDDIERVKLYLTPAKYRTVSDDLFDARVMQRIAAGRRKRRSLWAIAPYTAAAAVALLVVTFALRNEQPTAPATVALGSAPDTKTVATPNTFVVDNVTSVAELSDSLKGVRIITADGDSVTAEADYRTYQRVLERHGLADTSRYFRAARGLSLASSNGEAAHAGEELMASRKIVFTLRLRSPKGE